MPYLLAFLLLVSTVSALAQQKRPMSPTLNCRDAVTGTYVTPEFAKANPKTTVCEAAPPAKPQPKK